VLCVLVRETECVCVCVCVRARVRVHTCVRAMCSRSGCDKRYIPVAVTMFFMHSVHRAHAKPLRLYVLDSPDRLFHQKGVLVSLNPSCTYTMVCLRQRRQTEALAGIFGNAHARNSRLCFQPQWKVELFAIISQKQGSTQQSCRECNQR
jgi:hypothetical protein